MPSKERLSLLLGKGYFPRELPPVFRTDDFGRYIGEILQDWENAGVFSKKASGKLPGGGAKRDCYSYKVDSAEAEIISMPKRGYERRNLQITHPLPQALLSHELSENWRAVQKWLARQTYSLDEIQLSEQFERSIKGINFPVHRAKKAYIEATSDWLVRTDISRFYPSIYTHSLPWAAYGKERVKSQLKLYQGTLADRLDQLIRACNRNQTIGIPIGPETSRIIAEVISSRIDADFQDAAPKIVRESVDRLQDDWFVGVDTLEKAETVLSIISAIYRQYGLEINGQKTSIEHIVASVDASWISELGAFLSHRPGAVHGARLKELLSLSLRLQSAAKSEPVVNYVLSTIEGHSFGAEDVEVLESFLLKAAVISPISMSHICRVILNLRSKTKRISRRRICERFTRLAERNLENGNLYEAIWLLYTLRGLKTPLNSKRASEVAEVTPSSALALVLLDLKSKRLCTRALPEASWTAQITKDKVRTDWTWLLGYEGIRHGWLKDPNNVMADDLFRPMAARNVVFYDPARNVPDSTKFVRQRRIVRRKQSEEVENILRSLRGFNFGVY
jgi:hypothetical protein